MELTWKIVDCNRTLPEDYVQTAHWTLTAVDGEFSGSVYGSVGFDGELSIPYEELTESVVIQWVQQQLGEETVAAHEAAVVAQIESQKNPVSASGTPW